MNAAAASLTPPSLSTRSLSTLAVENEPLLRRIADEGAASVTALARDLDRDVSNTSKSIAKLRIEGLLKGDSLGVTDKGQRALDGLDVAAGRRFADTAIMVRHGDLSPHPDNPRKELDEEETQALAALIDASGGIKTRLWVTPEDEAGHRYIVAGQRRWLAVGLLIEDGRWDRERPLPCETREAETKAEAVLLGLMENSGAPLSRMDEAVALQFIQRSQGWNAAEVARRTGRSIRVVQQRLQVLDSASPEDLAAVAAGDKNYTDLRDAAQTPKAAVEPAPVLDLHPSPLAGEGGARAPDEGCDSDPAEEITATGFQGRQRANALDDLSAEASAGAEAPAIAMTDADFHAFAELAHKIWAHGVTRRIYRCVEIQGFHSDPIVRRLIGEHRVAAVFQPDGALWMAYLTERGQRYAAEMMAAHGRGLSHPDDAALSDIRFEAGIDAPKGVAYVNAWLNDAPKAAAASGLTGDAFSQQMREAAAETEPAQASSITTPFALNRPDLRVIDAMFRMLTDAKDYKPLAERSDVTPGYLKDLRHRVADAVKGAR